MEEHRDLRKIYTLSAIISGSIVASLFFYALILEIIKKQLEPFRGIIGLRDSLLIRYLLYGSAILLVIAVRILQRRLLEERPGEDSQVFLRRLSRIAIVTAALCEVPAILGFVYFLFTGTARDFYILFFVSLFLEFMFYPRLKTWEAIMKGMAK